MLIFVFQQEGWILQSRGWSAREFLRESLIFYMTTAWILRSRPKSICLELIPPPESDYPAWDPPLLRDSFEKNFGGKFIDHIKSNEDLKKLQDDQRRCDKEKTEEVLYGNNQDLDVLLALRESFAGYDRKRKATFLDSWDNAKKRKLFPEKKDQYTKKWRKYNFDVEGLLQCVNTMKEKGEKVRG